MLDWFLSHRRPEGWEQWAEVVWRDERAPKFIGDMPHTWVGSDFMRSVLDMLVYPREEDEALVLGAGVPFEWARDPSGVGVSALPTPYGSLHYTMRQEGDGVEVRIEGALRIPRGGIVVRAPFDGTINRATVNGKRADIGPDGEIIVRELPALVRVE